MNMMTDFISFAILYDTSRIEAFAFVACKSSCIIRGRSDVEPQTLDDQAEQPFVLEALQGRGELEVPSLAPDILTDVAYKIMPYVS